jgi:hypothetical protein
MEIIWPCGGQMWGSGKRRFGDILRRNFENRKFFDLSLFIFSFCADRQKKSYHKVATFPT